MCFKELDNQKFESTGDLILLLRQLPDDTPITICDAPGILQLNHDRGYVSLTADSDPYGEWTPPTEWLDCLDF